MNCLNFFNLPAILSSNVRAVSKIIKINNGLITFFINKEISYSKNNIKDIFVEFKDNIVCRVDLKCLHLPPTLFLLQKLIEIEMA